MQLAETVCVALGGPQQLLDLDGRHWGDDILFDSTTGGLDADAGFKGTTKVLTDVVRDVLIAKCGYRSREILFFGFGQGGMAALQLAGEKILAFSFDRDNTADILLKSVPTSRCQCCLC